MKDKKWLDFIRVERPNRKTKVFMVMPKGSDYELGEIKWYSQWRHYCFFPTLRFETVHSNRCLIEISDFITKLNVEHKGGKKNRLESIWDIMAKKNEKKIDWRVLCVGIICLTAIEVIALLNGINGTFRMLITAAIAAAIGITLPQIKTK